MQKGLFRRFLKKTRDYFHAMKSNYLSTFPFSGNCVRHRVIIARGYNGTPDNIKACNEGGCKRCWDMSIEHGE